MIPLLAPGERLEGGDEEMAAIGKDVEIGFEVTQAVKHMTQAMINDFEHVFERPSNIHDSEEVAKKEGLKQPIASGMMSIAFMHEVMQTAFGDGWDKGGKVSLRFIRPVLDGDTVTARAVVKEKQQENGRTRVILDAWCENQNGDKTAVGWASGLV